MTSVPEHIGPLLVVGMGLAVAITTLALRRIGRAKASLMAAMLLGCLVGPTVLGRVAPEVHDGLRLGNRSEVQVQQQRNAEARARAWLEGQRLDSGGSGPDESSEAASERGLLDWCVAGGCLLLLGMACLRDREMELADLPIGSSLAVVCGGAGLLTLRLLGEWPGMVAAAVFVGACAAAACARWRPFGGRRMRLAGPARVATTLVLSFLGLTIVITGGSETGSPLTGLMLCVPLVAWMISIRNHPRLARAREELVVLIPPIVVGLSMLSIDLLEQAEAFWLGVLAWLVMSDLRCLLAAALLRSTGLDWRRSWMNSLHLMGSEVMPVALAGYAYWVLDAPTTIVFALFIASTMCQIEGVTRPMAGRIIRATRENGSG